MGITILKWISEIEMNDDLLSTYEAGGEGSKGDGGGGGGQAMKR